MISISSRPSAPPSPACGIEPGDREPRLGDAEIALQAAQRRAPARFDQRGRSGCSATSASGTWVVTGTVRSVGPASIIATLPRRHAAALGDEFGLAGMGEADRVKLFLGDRASDHRRGRAGAGKAHRDLERIERAMRAGDARMAGHVGLGRRDLDQRQAESNARVRLARIVDELDRPVPDARDRRADRRSRRTAAGRTRARWSQHLAMTSGPIPAGSPSETASGEAGIASSTAA